MGHILTKDTEMELFAAFSRNGQRWRVIFDTRSMSSKNRGAAGIRSLHPPSEMDFNVEDPPRGLPHMPASSEQVHRLNSVAAHVCAYCTRTPT